jgi:hypothetical protein
MARQNGKSTLAAVLALYFMYVRAARLIIGTAQNLDIAEEVWQDAVDIAESNTELAEEISRVVKTNGKKSLELVSGERYRVQAASRRGGRGLSGDLAILDELREHHTWDAWSAISKTTLARPRAQIWALSNAGDTASIVLRHLMLLAHRQIGDPDGVAAENAALLGDSASVGDDDTDDSLGFFEWSAPPGCGLGDPGGTAQSNPALGHTISARAISSARRTDPEWVFRTEVLCQWADGSTEGLFPSGAWEACRDEASQIAADSPIAFGLDVSWDRAMTYIAAAGWRGDGLAHVEVIAQRAGTDWPATWFGEKPERGRPVAVQSRGAPASGMADDLRDAGVDVVDWSGSDVSSACGALYDRVRAAVGEGTQEAGVRHLGQPVLDVAAATAVTKPMGDAWVLDRRKSPADCSPMMAAVGALWLLTSNPASGVSAYADHDLMIV